MPLGTWLFVLRYGLFNQCQVVETGNAPTVGQVEWWNWGIGPITIVREVRPNNLVHSMERLRAVHEREGGNVGQVDLDQFSVHFLQLSRIGLGRDRLDQFVSL